MIIVIGATSFIGVHTVTELVRQGCEILLTGLCFLFGTLYQRRTCHTNRSSWHNGVESGYQPQLSWHKGKIAG